LNRTGLLRDALIATGEHLQRLTDLTHALATRAGKQAAAIGVSTSVKKISRNAAGDITTIEEIALRPA